MADKKDSGDPGELSDSFKEFFGIIVIIAFVLAFWNAFKNGKIKELTPTQQVQNLSPQQTGQ